MTEETKEINGRPVRKIVLPMSGYTIYLATYFTRGERREIARIYLEGVTVSQDKSKPEVQGIRAVTKLDSGDKAVVSAVKKIVNKQGEEIPVNIEVINNLTEDDGDFLEKEVNKIGMPIESKKKL